MLGPKFRPNEPKCLTCSGGKDPRKNIFGTKFGPKSGPKLGFLSFFKFGFLVFLEIA